MDILDLYLNTCSSNWAFIFSKEEKLHKDNLHIYIVRRLLRRISYKLDNKCIFLYSIIFLVDKWDKFLCLSNFNPKQRDRKFVSPFTFQLTKRKNESAIACCQWHLYNKTPKVKDVVIKLNGKLMQKFINHIDNNNSKI
jgi:hypothetical protein